MNLETFLTIMPKEFRSQVGEYQAEMGSTKTLPFMMEGYQAENLAECQNPVHADYKASLPEWVKYLPTEKQVKDLEKVRDRITEEEYLEGLQMHPADTRMVCDLMLAHKMKFSKAKEELENIP